MDFVDKNATWDDVNAVIINLEKRADDYRNDGDFGRVQYIMDEIVPIIRTYVSASELAKYPPYGFLNLILQ